jgi:hypothetical protein
VSDRLPPNSVPPDPVPPNPAEALLEHHPFNAGPENLELFRSLEGVRDPEAWNRFGRALGAFHLEFKGAQLPGLPVRDAAWFSRAAPYVLAEVASLAERGEYELTMAQTGLLEEAGIMLAELSEPLTGLLSSFVHGHCTLSMAGFVGERACLRDWSHAAKAPRPPVRIAWWRSSRVTAMPPITRRRRSAI